MKYLLCFALLISTSLHASRLEDIEDKLDEMQNNLMQSQIDRLIERQNRSQIKSPSNRGETLSQTSLIKNSDKIIISNAEKIVAIRTDTILKITDSLIRYSVIIQYDKPQYTAQNKTYFNLFGVLIADCKNKKHAMASLAKFDKTLDIVEMNEFPSLYYTQLTPAQLDLRNNHQIGIEFNYVCSSVRN